MTALAGLAACAGTPGAPRPPAPPPDEAPRSTLAEDDSYRPSYGKTELARALASERASVAAAERQLADLADRAPDPATSEQLRVVAADLAVRRRFIATLEVCEAGGPSCPPRLDEPAWAWDPDPDLDRKVEPPVTATLRFDLESWRTLASELHGRACACRTQACLDSLGVAIDQLELRPMPQVLGDEAATVSITRARDCLFRLRGKRAMRMPAAAPVEE